MLKLYPPGTRKNNRYYVAKGYIAGREYEVVCRDKDRKKTANRRDAEQFVRAFEKKVTTEAAKPKRQSDVLSFGDIADTYATARGISRNDERYLEKLKKAWLKSKGVYLRDLAIADVRQKHVAEAANFLYHGRSNETKNRQAYTPAAAVVHFAADNGDCAYIVIKKLPEKEPETRRPAPGVAKLLLDSTSGDKQLLMMFLFYQGFRITESLKSREDKINLKEQTISFWIPKRKKWKPIYLHDEVFRTLKARLPIGRPDGLIFPWRDRHEVYDWLGPLCMELDIEFTPHMARHEFGSTMRENGAHPRDIADAGTWSSDKSTMRYSQAPARAKALLKTVKYDAEPRGKTRGKKRSA